MKILTNLLDKSSTVILENFQPEAKNTKTILSFSKELISTPEVIGGIYYFDCHNQEVRLELKNNGLFALVATLEAVALRTPLHIMYDNTVAPIELFARLFNKPVWLIKVMQFFGLIKRSLTYTDFIHYAKSCPRVFNPIHKPNGHTCPADRDGRLSN